jgi:hypothetical protein
MSAPSRSTEDATPDDRLRRWHIFRGSVLRQIVAQGVELDLAEESVDAVREVFLRCEGGGHQLTARPGNIEEALQGLSDWVTDFGTALLVEIVLREIKLRAAGLR